MVLVIPLPRYKNLAATWLFNLKLLNTLKPHNISWFSLCALLWSKGPHKWDAPWSPHKEALSACKGQLRYRHQAFRNNNVRKHNAPTCSLVLTLSFYEGLGWGEGWEISSRLAALPRQEEGGTDAWPRSKVQMPYREASQLISYIILLNQKLLNFADSYSSLERSKLLPAKTQQELLLHRQTAN